MKLDLIIKKNLLIAIKNFYNQKMIKKNNNKMGWNL
jgi:hypothetical protein